MVDAPGVPVVFDAHDVKPNVCGVDVVNAQEMVGSLDDAFLFSAVYGFYALLAQAPLANLDFNKYPGGARSANQVDFKPLPSPISGEDSCVLFFEVDDRECLSPTASFGSCHVPKEAQ